MNTGIDDERSQETSDAVKPSAYLVCAVQRSGSWFLCHALEDTGMLGYPAEYFNPGDEAAWRQRWAASTEDEFLVSLVEKPRTPNGVWGSKLMSNQLDDALTRFCSWPALKASSSDSDRDVLETALPGLRYVWLRRRDYLRQGISWWRAAATDQYARTFGEASAPIPSPDLETIEAMARLAQTCDEDWGKWFARHEVEPLELVYEEVIEHPVEAVGSVCELLGVTMPADFELRPRIERQADWRTDEIVERLRGRSDPH